MGVEGQQLQQRRVQSAEADGKCPGCSVTGNAFGKYQFVVDRMKVGSLALGVWSLSH